MSYLAAHWSLAWPALIGYALAVGVHLTGLRRLTAVSPAPGGQPDSGTANLGREAVAFHLGLLAVLLAMVTPIGYWSEVYIWVRSIQDLLLAVVATALIVLGAPWRPLSAGLRPLGKPAHQAQAAAPVLRGQSAPSWWLARPAATTAVYTVIWLSWHIPALYDAAATNAAVRYAQYACYLGAGVLFWLQLIGSRPSSPVAPPLRRVVLLVGALMADTLLGMVLVFGSGAVYPAYPTAAHRTLSLVADQQMGGAILWMGMLPPFVIAVIALLVTWLDDEERDDPTRDLDRLARRWTTGWPSRTGAAAAAWQPRPRYRRSTP
jgi:putative membrane protein